MILITLTEERTYILPSIFVDCFYDYILYIGNNSWHKEVYSEENGLDSISSNGENDCCRQNQNVSDPKQKQQAIGNHIEIRRTYKNNLITGYLNINLPRNKIMSLHEIIDKALLNILCIDETKLDEDFTDCQF